MGDPVKKGDVLADVETDKATMELESYKDGTVLYIGVKDGEKLNVDDLLLIVGKEGEDFQSLLNGKSGGGQAEAPVKDAGSTGYSPAGAKRTTGSGNRPESCC